MKKLTTAEGSGDSDLKFALDALLAAYRPFLESELKLSGSSTDLQSQAATTCDDEIRTARELFERFFTKEVAMRLLPNEGKETLGNVDEWEWCYRHILCCLIFGWLVCRGPITFKSFAYYLERYWRCVREVIGRPVSNPLTPQDAGDLRKLVQILASAYTPYLDAQRRDAEYPMNLPEEIEAGTVDCTTDQNQTDSIFERLMTPDAVRILFGSSESIDQGNQLAFRACRCYCICALEFGCCLGRSRTLKEVELCLEWLYECLRRCFESLIAEIDTPAENACAELTVVASCSNLQAIEITGTAAGSAFNYYSLTYSLGGPAINAAVVYPDCSTPPGTTTYPTAVVGGVLGYLNFDLIPPGVNNLTIYLDVYGSGGLHQTVTRDIQLEIRAVEITAVAMVQALVGADPFHTADMIKLIKAVNDPNPTVPEQSVGGSFSVSGSAYTFGCGRQMTQYQLVKFAAPPALDVPTPSSVSGAIQDLLPLGPVVYMDTPNHPWQSGCFFPTPNTILNGNLVAQWTTNSCFVPFPTPHSYTIPKISSTDTWYSGTSGRFVIFLEVDDSTSSPLVFPGTFDASDQVAVWIDNFTPIANIASIGGISGCGYIHLANYYQAPAAVLGQAWDYPIDPTAPQQAPNDNFGSYSMSFQMNGGAGGVISVATPNTRVPNVWPNPPTTNGLLATWDISSNSSASGLDGGPTTSTCQPWQLLRGQQCSYVVVLQAVDTTWVGDSGSHNYSPLFLYAITVINDIPLTLPVY
jgi:hypothetical protein